MDMNQLIDSRQKQSNRFIVPSYEDIVESQINIDISSLFEK